MASSGNTWCKKLMAKQKKFTQRHARKPHALTFTLAAAKDAEAKLVKSRAEPKEFRIVMKSDFNPGRGRKGTLSREYRAAVEARKVAREALFSSLKSV